MICACRANLATNCQCQEIEKCRVIMFRYFFATLYIGHCDMVDVLQDLFGVDISVSVLEYLPANTLITWFARKKGVSLHGKNRKCGILSCWHCIPEIKNSFWKVDKYRTSRSLAWKCNKCFRCIISDDVRDEPMQIHPSFDLCLTVPGKVRHEEEWLSRPAFHWMPRPMRRPRAI